MRLQQLMAETDWTERTLGDEVGVSQVSIHRIKSGDQQPRAVLALRIEVATHGAVKAHEMPLSSASQEDLAFLRGLIRFSRNNKGRK